MKQTLFLLTWILVTTIESLHGQGYASIPWVLRGSFTGDLKAVSCGSSTTCYAAGDGHWIKSTDGGLTWTEYTSFPINGFPFSCGNVQNVYAINADTVIFYTEFNGGSVLRGYRTTDGGQTFTALFDLGKAHRMEFVNDSVGYACGFVSFGIRKTTDAGATWNNVWTTSNTRLTDLSCPSAQYMYVCDENGHVWRSSDSGQTFVQILNLQPTNPCFCGAMGFLNDSTGWLFNRAGANAILYKTTDYGNTWTDLSANYYSHPNAGSGPPFVFEPIDSLNLYVGSLYSWNSGSDWIKDSLGSPANSSGVIKVPNVDRLIGVDCKFCSVGKIATKELSVGVNTDQMITESLFIYPNPTTGKIKVSAAFEQLTISDIHGKVIFYESDGNSESLISLENLSDGMYFARIQHKNHVINQKIIKYEN